MKNLKIGDKVIHTNTKQTGKITSINNINGYYVSLTGKVEEDSVFWFHFNTKLQSTITKEKEIGDSSYQFHSSCINDIDWKLIITDLSKQNPLALISITDINKKEVRYLAIHTSIRNKAIICNIALPNTLHDINSGVFKIGEQFSIWIKWAKKVKTAKWPDEIFKKTLVTVTKAKI